MIVKKTRQTQCGHDYCNALSESLLKHMSSIVKLFRSGSGDKVELGDAMCSICLSLMVEPVVMPCQHALCLGCFNNTVKSANLACPICRMRISVWCRRNAKSKTIVDQNLWNFIKDKFPSQVESVLSGCDNINIDEVFPCVPSHQFAEQGDIKEEFEDEMRKVREEDRRKREEEERLGVHLAEELEREEHRRLEEAKEQETQGLEAARRMWRDMTQQSPVVRKRNRSVMDMFKTASPSPLKSNGRESQVIQTPPLEDGTYGTSAEHDTTTVTSNNIFDFPTPEDNSDDIVSLPHNSKDNELSVLFSQEMIEEQKKIEMMLQQEKKDQEFANILQREASEAQCPSVFLTPRSSVRRPSGEKSKGPDVPSKRQLSLLDCSPRTALLPSTSRIPDSPSKLTSKKLNYNDQDEQNFENQSIYANKIAQSQSSPSLRKSAPTAIDLLKRKIEKDLQSNIAGCSYQSEDELLARRLQRELDKESMLSKHNTKPKDDTPFMLKSASKKSLSSCKVKHKIISCNKCQACLRDNCGKCSPCRDMPKFGGKHVLKQKCVYRKCVQPVKSSCSQCS